MNGSYLARFVEWSRTPQAGVALGLTAIGVVYLLTYHWAHTMQALPYVLVLLCPLLHLFMHAGHGNHSGRGTGDERGTHEGHSQR